MNMTCAPGASPTRSYPASHLLRSSALAPGNRVHPILPAGQDTGKDTEQVFLVSSQSDKKGNPILVDVDTGEAVTASPDSVWARW